MNWPTMIAAIARDVRERLLCLDLLNAHHTPAEAFGGVEQKRAAIEKLRSRLEVPQRETLWPVE